MRLTRTAAACLTLTLAGAMAATAFASAQGQQLPPGTSVTYAKDVAEAIGVQDLLMTPQQRDGMSEQALAVASDSLTAAAAIFDPATNGDYPDGFAGLVVNPATLTMDVWWKGSVSSTLTGAVRAAAPGVIVRWHDAVYTRDDLLRRIESVRPDLKGAELVFPRQDGAGVVATHTSDTPIDAQGIAGALGVPIVVTEDGAIVEDIGGRQADVAPHNGGAMMIHGTGICSTGFSVVDANNNGFLLSAAHCDTTGNLPWDNGANNELTPGGAYVSVILSIDSMLLNPNGGTSGYVYGGGPDSTTRRAVAGTATNNIGETVVLSGANSGAHGGLVIVNDAYPATCNGYSCTLIRANGDPNQEVSAGGDSGGPVYSIRADGRVTAKGIDHGHVTNIAQVYCTPQKYPGNACGDEVVYAPIRLVLASWSNLYSIETHS